MKTKAVLFFFSALIFITLQGCGTGYVNNSGSTGNDIQYDQNNQTPDNQSVAFDQQYNVDDLNQYGDWENYDSYGRVWRPSVAPGWQPFTNGHWAYDGYDWVWVSYEPFGWMVYHYGSWENTPEYGWVWIPEQDAWSPATVDWIYYDDQVAWAPRRAHNRLWSEPWQQDNVHPWVVVPMKDFNRENVISYRMNNDTRNGFEQPKTIERRQPDFKVVQSRVSEPIQTVKIEREPVQRNNVSNVVTPPVDRNPVDQRPPIDRNPQGVKPPENRNPVDQKPPVERNPVGNNQQQPGRNQNAPRVQPQNDKPIYHMQIPPQERQKVDKYRPAVEKNVLIKKAPDNRQNNNDNRQKNNQGKK